MKSFCKGHGIVLHRLLKTPPIEQYKRRKYFFLSNLFYILSKIIRIFFFDKTHKNH